MSVAPDLDDRFARELPELSVRWQAETAPEPRLLVLNEQLATQLGIEPGWLRGPDGVRFLTGNLVPEGAVPVAQAYAGHQFGGYVPRLGDGRALLLGELVTADGGLRDLHLKGSGRTPFARGGDGLAAVGPMLREYIISEAMHALGIPTTRSLAVVATGRTVQRETPLPGAVLARIASSHLRVGTFQYVAADGDADVLRRLADYAIARHYPDAADADNRYLALFDAVGSAQAALIAQWMLVGFVHGVMNTDNMTIAGETIDYGPCAFMDAYDPEAVFSSIDSWGRYAYGAQPSIAGWNLARFAETLLPLIADDQDRAVELAQESLAGFGQRLQGALASGMRAKLGLAADLDEDGTEGVATPLMNDALALLTESHVDFTSFFRNLGHAARGDTEPARGMFMNLAGFDEWLTRWRALNPDAAGMDRVNPVYIPRNHLVEETLEAATGGDLAPLGKLLEAISAPYDERDGLQRYAEPAPEDFGKYRTFCGT
ncbi:protein adenylyltransferase SelO [Mycolicibacterium tusciae]|uniref:protein adenylyltransferase SelO n=1 Tax=Mycolicibacterium tusciae TaxID=75922 RepID=UPI00030D88C5|nr:YdiU family protein [Mycolicibacterium tusciae]